MSANPHRRRLLGLFATAPIAAAAGVQPASVLGRARAMSLRVRGADRFSPVLGRFADELRGVPLPPAGEDLMELALALDTKPAPGRIADLVVSLGTDPGTVLAQQAAQARAIAALELAFPPEIAAYRSFGAPMRRRLYAELLTRESERLATASSPRMPPASSGPDA